MVVSCSVELAGFWETREPAELWAVVVGLSILHIASPTSGGSIPEDRVTTPIQSDTGQGTLELVMKLAITHVVNRVLRTIEDVGAIVAAGVLSARLNNLFAWRHLSPFRMPAAGRQRAVRA